MPIDIETIAQDAEMIVNGYAFTPCELGVRVLSLRQPTQAAVLNDAGDMLETSMDDVELDIVRDLFLKNKQFLGTMHAEIFRL